MDFFDIIKKGFSNAFDTVSETTQAIIEKNRVNSQLMKLRSVMKSECEMINRAYITLGKQYYEGKQKGNATPCENEEELFKIIADSKSRIKKARERYRQIIENQTVEMVKKYDIGDLEDITVVCSNEDEYGDSPFENENADETDIVINQSTDDEVAETDTF
ncbi:MAG: hypothetical protein PUD53_01725 [Oscillospiraceae bacterium]|nr:hypothetical protein [Oscillospiraceae bacterium]